MNLKEKIKQAMGSKELTLKEIYGLLLEEKRDSIRGIINSSLKSGKDFIRSKKATYRAMGDNE
jgi:23S rRNA maturation-related 3'-5' exoribonuclease YhaM